MHLRCLQSALCLSCFWFLSVVTIDRWATSRRRKKNENSFLSRFCFCHCHLLFTPRIGVVDWVRHNWYWKLLILIGMNGFNYVVTNCCASLSFWQMQNRTWSDVHFGIWRVIVWFHFFSKISSKSDIIRRDENHVMFHNNCVCEWQFSLRHKKKRVCASHYLTWAIKTYVNDTDAVNKHPKKRLLIYVLGADSIDKREWITNWVTKHRSNQSHTC